MLDDRDRDELQAETGFGTGLRAHLRGRHGDTEEELLPELPEVVAAEGEPEAPDRELEQERDLARLAAGFAERERSLTEQASALEAEAERLADERAELERHLDVRDLLRRRAEQEVERLWQTFSQALEATRPDGEPDFEVRLSAARALLAEAYAVPGESRPLNLPDELAALREKKVQHPK